MSSHVTLSAAPLGKYNTIYDQICLLSLFCDGKFDAEPFMFLSKP